MLYLSIQACAHNSGRPIFSVYGVIHLCMIQRLFIPKIVAQSESSRGRCSGVAVAPRAGVWPQCPKTEQRARRNSDTLAGHVPASLLGKGDWRSLFWFTLCLQKVYCFSFAFVYTRFTRSRRGSAPRAHGKRILGLQAQTLIPRRWPAIHRRRREVYQRIHSIRFSAWKLFVQT